RTARLPAIDTTVGIGIKYTAFFIGRDFGEIEQVPVVTRATGTTVADTAFALHRRIRRGVHRQPRLATVIRGRDERVPDSVEIFGRMLAALSASDETNGRATGIACYRFDEHAVMQVSRCNEVVRIRP